MKNIIIITSFVLFGSSGFAQSPGTHQWYANWNCGFPVGNNFVTSFSGLGFNLGYSHFIKEDFAVGIDFGWNNYYEYAPRQTWHFDGGAATTDLYKYLYTLPIMATATKTFHPSPIFKPFVRLGIGTQYSEQNIYYNVFQTTNTNWGFAVAPEIGTLVQLQKDIPWSLYLAIKYKYATNSATNFGVHDVQTINFAVGIACTFK
ncbi:MAG: hypothetical protein C5B59_00420 [Bacteroidetes bacterium]|nr:MAG: hypothetical protein C5B59_00420 [Bacteroidota bacterium]